jgi:hypothetical protein
VPPRSDVLVAGLRVTAREEATSPVRSYLPDGRCVGWYGPGAGAPTALDVELDRPPPRALAGRYGAQDFWARWTRAECAAKLLDFPIAVYLRQFGLDVPSDPRLELVTLRPRRLDPALVVTVGRRAESRQVLAQPSSAVHLDLAVEPPAHSRLSTCPTDCSWRCSPPCGSRCECTSASRTRSSLPDGEATSWR